jgi:hypothetical protein
MNSFYDLQLFTDLRYQVQCDMTRLLIDIDNYKDPSARDRIEKYTRFAANMHHTRLFSKSIFGRNESHLIHWMANLRERSSTSYASKQNVYLFLSSINDVEFMKLLCNVVVENPYIYLMKCNAQLRNYV